MSTELYAAITAANAELMEAFARGDSGGMAELYTADGQILPPNAEALTGPAAIGQFWAMVMTMGLKTVKLTTAEVTGAGDLAVEVGVYELGDGDGNTVDRGKYLVVWKQQDGSWRLHRDIWNSSQPAG